MNSWREAYGIGFSMLLLGGVFILLGFVGDLSGDSRVASLAGGYLAAGLGALLLQVGTIAWGVELGSRRIWDPESIPAHLRGHAASSPGKSTSAPLSGPLKILFTIVGLVMLGAMVAIVYILFL